MKGITLVKQEILGVIDGVPRLGKPRTQGFKSEEVMHEWLEKKTTARNGDWVANWERYELSTPTREVNR